MTVDKALLDTMGVTAERLFGYVYAGVLTFMVAWVIQPAPVEKLAQSVGSLVSLVLLVAVGGVVFALYYRIIGGLLLFPITHKLHQMLDQVRGRNDAASVTSSIAFLRLVGVKDPEAAYVEVKDSFVPQNEVGPLVSSVTGTRFHFAHCEINFFYLTAIVTFGSGVTVTFLDFEPIMPWFAVAGFSYALAVVADIRVHTFETTQMRNAKVELESFLQTRHFLALPSGARLETLCEPVAGSSRGA